MGHYPCSSTRRARFLPPAIHAFSSYLRAYPPPAGSCWISFRNISITGSKDEVTELLKLPFDFIFFTGSVKVGKIVMEAAAKNLTPVLLELGGQNPAFVDSTANIPDAAKKIVWGATAWGGQWCTSPGYAYVHESIAEQFVAECKKAMVELYGTDPKSRPDDYSRIITPKAT